MSSRRKHGHVGANLGEDVFGRAAVDAGNSV
jgi:hypothetical protein